MNDRDDIADVLLAGLSPRDRAGVVTRLNQAAQDERSAAEAGHPRPFPGPAPVRTVPPSSSPPAGKVVLSEAELDQAANAPWRGKA